MSRFALTATLVLLVAGSFDVAPALPNAAKTCAQLGRLTAVLPEATAVGFRVRREIRAQRARAPIWPGRCGALWTAYEGDGARVEVSITLYETSRAVAAPLAEPGPGPIRVLGNGARVRMFVGEVCRANYSDPGCVRTGRSTSVLSTYKNIFISSSSTTSLMQTPASIPSQVRVHRTIQEAFQSLG